MTTAGRRPGAVCAARRINRPARRRAVFTLHLPQQAGLCYTPYYGRSLKRPAFMTLAEFLAWDAPGGPAWQLIDGVPEAMAPASGTHAVMQGEVGRLIGNHLAAHRPGCRVLTNPGVVPRVNSEDNFRIPDLGVTCSPVPRGVIEIAEPILLIEILSPGNTVETWTNVWACTNIPSVQEILVIRTASIGVQLLRRAPDRSWPEVPLGIEAGELELESVGFRVPVAALYAGTWLVEAT
jgi:Uma2 family endonuclease